MATTAQKIGTAALGASLAISAALAFGVLRPQNLTALAGPSPTGSGYVVTRAGVTQGIALAGTPGTQVAGWCDAGGGAAVPCAVSSNGSPPTTGLCASRPSATGSGALYFCTDAPLRYLDSPATSSWWTWANVGAPISFSPQASAFTLVTQTAQAVTLQQVADAIRVSSMGGNNSVALQAGSLSSSGIWAATIIATNGNAGNHSYPDIGVAVTTGTTAGSSTMYSLSSEWIGLIATNTTPTLTLSNYFNYEQSVIASTSRSVYGLAYGPVMQSGEFVYLRALADGFQLHWQSSENGIRWWDITTPGNTPSSLTDWGFFVGNAASYTSEIETYVVRADLTTPTSCTISSGTGATPPVLTVNAGCTIKLADMIRIYSAGCSSLNNANWFVSAVAGTSVTLGYGDVSANFQSATGALASCASPFTGGTAVIVSR